MRFINPPEWPRPKGYSNGVIADGQVVYLAGQVGWDEQEKFTTSDFVGQALQAFKNIAALLKEAGGGPEHLVRMTWFVVDREGYLSSGRALGAAYREVFGRNFPVMSVIIVAGLIEDGAKLEIEATAVLPRS